MLAVGRALMSDPKLLMLDEPSLGLAPAVVESMYETFGRLHKEGLTILLAEQSIELALEVSDFATVLQVGKSVLSGTARRLSPTIRRCSTPISAPADGSECMSANSGSKPFPGTIANTVAGSKPWWPAVPKPPAGAPNILVVLFDDVGFSDFGCYGSPIRTPVIDALAAGGLRYTGFHTTAMCSTTRAALLTGRNHHSVGVGCLANFNSGYPGYRGKIAREAGTLAEMLKSHAYRSYMVGKWHVTPLTESGATGPFDGWPLGRGFDRFYGFLDAETINTRRSSSPTTPTSIRPGLMPAVVSPAVCRYRDRIPGHTESMIPAMDWFQHSATAVSPAIREISPRNVETRITIYGTLQWSATSGKCPSAPAVGS